MAQGKQQPKKEIHATGSEIIDATWMPAGRISISWAQILVCFAIQAAVFEVQGCQVVKP